MNERIRQLAIEAGFYVADDKIYTPLSREEITKYQQKFAELIVQECADRLMQGDFGSVKGVMSIAGARLKEHFGVEE